MTINLTTANLLALISEVAKVEMAPFTKSDFQGYADADADAQIGHSGSDRLVELVCEISEKSILTEGGEAITIVASGSMVEIYAMTPDYDTVCLGLNLDSLI